MSVRLRQSMTKLQKDLKAPLRNFTLCKPADEELARLKVVTGKNMTAVLEDLILGRRQFGEQVESFLTAEALRTGMSRHEIVELAVLMFFTNPPNSPNPNGNPLPGHPVAPLVVPSSKKQALPRAPAHKVSSAKKASPSRKTADILESVVGSVLVEAESKQKGTGQLVQNVAPLAVLRERIGQLAAPASPVSGKAPAQRPPTGRKAPRRPASRKKGDRPASNSRGRRRTVKT